MEKNTNQVHPSFDFELATNLYSKFNQNLRGEKISSPFDLYSVQYLRKRYNLQMGTSIPADVFVWSYGDPPDQRLTKVAGVPFWPKGDDWPHDKHGKKYLFLAQFCFLDSQDIMNNLPGDLLTIFVPQNNNEWMWETDSIYHKWIKTKEVESIEEFPIYAEAYSVSQWYGVIYRSADYPDSEELADNIDDVHEPYNLSILNATKIGGIPNLVQFNQGGPDLEFICQLNSIQPADEVPFPWANRKDPFDLSLTPRGINYKDNQLIFLDMANIYIFIDKRGSCHFKVESY